MLKRSLYIFLAICLVTLIVKLAIPRGDKPVISNPAYLEMVEEDFQMKKNLIENDSLFKIFDKCRGKREREALKFLYAYMPIGDIADYNPQIYLDGVRHALMVRRKMAWGDSIPEDIFRHFVLPVRANNEALDSSRVVFYNELKDRVKGISMYDAVIEVNRWCQEKVVYTPSDERTSSPLATVRTAYGRCGEESVFTVAAMRSVGIPARQVYTPRWAHTDDNHAWVEVWVAGKWYYLGACEPEPRLNVAWFSATAQRGLLMHCRVFGFYEGVEDIIRRTPVFTEINVTANYAPVSEVKIKVTDTGGNPVEGAVVDYKIYNYAELYSAISTVTDAGGLSHATLGRGDVVVWAHKDGKFGFARVTPGGENFTTENVDSSKQNEAIVQITLNHSEGDVFAQDLDIVPPAEGKAQADISKEEREENNRRIARGDSLRRAYIATFADSNYVKALAGKLEADGKNVMQDGQNFTKEKIARFLYASRGNYREIAKFLEWLHADNFKYGLDMLEVITEKDLRDTPSKVLESQSNLAVNGDKTLSNQKSNDEQQYDIFKRYLLNPRIGKELLGCWREFLTKEEFKNNPQAIVEFCRKIKPASKYNPQNIPVTPVGVYKMMAADKASAEGLFIAICRSSGIPARFEEVTGRVQYFFNGSWIEADIFESATTAVQKRGRLMVNYRGKVVDDPKFETHFTIARLENGVINTLNFRNKEGYEGTNTLKGTFREPVELEAGYYMLTCGTRMASGKVLGRVALFIIADGKTTNVELIMRDDPQDLRVIGNLNPEAQFYNAGAGKSQSIIECTGRGFFVLAFLKPNHEPSTHAIRDILKYSNELQAAGRPIIFLVSEAAQLDDISALRENKGNLPPIFVTGADTGDKILTGVSSSLKLGADPTLPLIIVADTFGRIVWSTQGYNIGTGDNLAKVLGLCQGQSKHLHVAGL